MIEKRPLFVPADSYSPERYAPYRVMWLKVIVRAAYDYTLWKDSDDLKMWKFARDAERWLFDPSALSNSFEKICHSCHFPQDRLRTWARELTKDQVKKLEFLERQGKDSACLSIAAEVTCGESR